MENEVIGQEVQDESAAMESLLKGYQGKAHAAEAASTEPEETQSEPEPQPEPEPTAADRLASELASLKEQVKGLAHNSEATQKLHGQIGDINRTLQTLQKPAPAPVEDEVSVALTEAQKVADEFPELAGPLMKAIKALSTTRHSPVEQTIDMQSIKSHASEEVETRLQLNAIDALKEEHPDYETVRTTPEFLAWEKTKPAEYQKKLRTTWNPAVVARGLTEFKDSLKAKQKKQDRLASGVVAPSTTAVGKTSILPDEAGLWNGYNKGLKRR